jgi:hypothetical protein
MKWLAVTILALASACNRPAPPPVDPPAPIELSIAVTTRGARPIAGAAVSCDSVTRTETDLGGLARLALPSGAVCDLVVQAEAYLEARDRFTVTEPTTHPVTLNRQPRPGRVRLEGRSFADDAGAWNPLGATLFWSLWGERHDADRLDRNLAYLSDHGVDFVRILAMVGTASWSDRVIDPHAPDYWSVVDRFFDRLAVHGMRAHVTVFADAQAMMPNASDRDAFLDRWVDVANARLGLIQVIEIANEHWQNGVTTSDVRTFAARAQARTPLPVALSAPQEHEAGTMYRGWTSAATMHYDRDTSRADGFWRPVRQPWGWPAEYFPDGGQPPAVMNSEPIGPKSSVAEDADPARLAASYLTTFVSGNASYTYHAGSGIRGGGQFDLDRGRQANLFDEDPAILATLERARALLPPGVASWTRHNAQWESMPWSGSAEAVERGDIIRAYAATSGDRLAAVIIGIRRTHRITARVPLALNLIDPQSSAVVATIDLQPGQSADVPAPASGAILALSR